MFRAFAPKIRNMPGSIAFTFGGNVTPWAINALANASNLAFGVSPELAA
jgi:hypothetical protein